MSEYEQDRSNLPLFYHPFTHAPGTDAIPTAREQARVLAAGKQRRSLGSKARRTRVNQVVDDLTQMALLRRASRGAPQDRHFL